MYRCNLRDERFANIAMLEANKSNMKYHKHGCVAVVGGDIIARGYNTDRCHSNDGFLEDVCSCHAEIDVMRKLTRMFRKKSSASVKTIYQCAFYERVSLYVVRQDTSGIIYKDSAPCARCSEVMKSLHIKYIIYSNSEGTLTKCRVRDYNTTHISQGNRFLNKKLPNIKKIMKR